MNANYIIEKLSNPESYNGLDQFMTDARKEIPEVSAALRKRETPPIAFSVTDPAAAPDFAPFRPFDTPAQDALPPFPWETTPPELSNFMETMRDFAETDYALAAVPALAACAVAVGKKFRVSPKAGWNEPLNLYALTCAVSGERKSAVMKWVTRPLEEYQSEWNYDNAGAFDEWRDKLEVTQAEIAAKKTLIAKGKASFDDLAALQERRRSLEANPERPLRLFLQDCTPEQLERELEENGETMSIISDEGGLLVTLTGGRYCESVNLECLLKSFTGDRVQTTRVGRKGVHLERPCLNVNVMCQPVTVKELTENKTFNLRGLTARFLYAFAKPMGGKRTGDRPPPLDDAVNAYNNLIRDLLSITPDYDERGKDTPRTIAFSDEAYASYLEFFAENESLLRELDDNDPFRAWAARLTGYAVRLAGVLHVCAYRNDADAVALSAEEFQKAVTLARYFKAHAEYAFSMSGASMSESERDALYIWKRIQESGQAQIAKRDLNRLCQRFKRAEEMDAGLNELVTRGYIRIVKSGEGRGRKSETIETNPEANQ